MAINNRYLDFVQTRGLISLVNDNHVNNNLKEILVFVYIGSIVNNRPENTYSLEICMNFAILETIQVKTYFIVYIRTTDPGLYSVCRAFFLYPYILQYATILYPAIT